MVDYTGAVKRGLKFSLQPKRWGAFFILDFVFLTVLLFSVSGNLIPLVSMLVNYSFSSIAFSSVFMYVFALLIGLCVWVLLRVWITGAVVYQSYKEKDFGKSWKVSRERFFSLTGALIVITSLSLISNLVILVGWLLSIIVSLFFFFVFQDLIITNKDTFLALNASLKIFKRKPLTVIIAWILVTIVSLVIVGIFSIPLLLFLLNLSGVGASSVTGILTALIFSLETNTAALILTGVILLIGIEISQVFALKTQTEIYLQVKKRRLF